MRSKRPKGRGLTLDEAFREEMKDPEFLRLYHEADIQLRVSLAMTKAREDAGMTQRQLADAIKTKQQTVSRIEAGAQNVTIETLDRIARALQTNLQITFKKLSPEELGPTATARMRLRQKGALLTREKVSK